ncbi:hypothetical protein [Roseiconus lacunae]|uniref:hypothetical protein n=1 Tax=Roseiconus lacunae TaxID=2605694 RepID=UPI001E395B99|nr:hypothetical protein [Roseiconus lacunae]MCD0458756.1 hypothetical protein [Roseiconus lacunae]
MKDMNKCKNVFEAILRYGHDEDFVPQEDVQFSPSDDPVVGKPKSSPPDKKSPFRETRNDADFPPKSDDNQESREPEHGRARITLSIPDHMSDDEAKDLAIRLIRSLNAAYKQQGGNGLTIDDTTILSASLEPVGVEA